MKKLLLGMGMLAPVMAPLAGVISCNGSSGDSSAEYNKKQITIELGDPKWRAYFEKIVVAFNASHPNAKYKVKIVETKSNDKLKNGAKLVDKDVADIFMLPSNETALLENDYLAPITDNLKNFLSKVGKKGVNFTEAAISVSESSKKSGKYYGITQNTEGILFAKYTKTVTPVANKSSAESAKKVEDTLMLTPTNLWFSVGTLNTNSNEGNFKNVLTESNAGIYSQHTEKYETKIKDLYTNIVAPIKNFRDENKKYGGIQEVFNKDGGIAAKALQEMIALKLSILKTNASIVAPAGTWELENYVGNGKKGGLVLGKNGIKGVEATLVAPSKNYKQWGGAWEYFANARNAMSNDRMKEIKEIIQEFLKPSHALDMFKIWGKFMPTTEGLNEKLFTKEKPYVIKALSALKGLTVMQKPNGAGFDSVWASGWGNPTSSIEALKNKDNFYNTIKKSMESVVKMLNN